MVPLTEMWKLVVFVWLAGTPVSWTPDPDKPALYTEEQCEDYAAGLERDLIETVQINDLSKGQGFIVSTWCVQTNPKETKL